MCTFLQVQLFQTVAYLEIVGILRVFLSNRIFCVFRNGDVTFFEMFYKLYLCRLPLPLKTADRTAGLQKQNNIRYDTHSAFVQAACQISN